MGIKELAKAVRIRRIALDMNTTIALANRAEVTSRTIRAIESEEKESFRADTLLKLDTALNWQPGSSSNLLETGAPPEEIPTATREYTYDDEGNADGTVYTSGNISIESSEPEQHEYFTISIDFKSNPAINTDDLIDLAHSMRRHGNSVLAEIQKVYMPILDQGELGKMRLAPSLASHIAEEAVSGVNDDDLEWAASPHEETEIPYAE